METFAEEINTIDRLDVSLPHDTALVEDHSNLEATPATNAKTKYSNSRPERLCIYCNVYTIRLFKHMKSFHRGENELKELFKASPSKRREVMTNIRKKGILKHNLTVINRNDGKLQMEKRCTSDKWNAKMCTKCNAFLSHRTSSSHKCSRMSASHMPCINALSLRMLEEDLDFAQNIVCKLHNDATGRVCKEDDTILILGRRMYLSKKVSSKNKATMKYMRQLAALSIEFKDAADRHEKRLQTIDMFNYKHFDYLIVGLDSLTVKKNNLIHNMRLTYGYTLRTAAEAIQEYYLLVGDDAKLAKMAEDFLVGFKRRWDSLFKASEMHGKERRQKMLQNPARLPPREHLQTIKTHIVNTLSRFDHENDDISKLDYISLRRLTVTRLIFLNGRRVNEPGRLKIKQITEAFKSECINKSALAKLPEKKQRQIMEEYYITYIEGKIKGNLIVVLIPKFFKKYLEILMSPKARANSNIHPDNDYVFPSSTNSLYACSGWHDVSFVVRSCVGLQKLNATDMRRFLSTAFSEMTNNEDSKKMIYSHLRHSEKVSEKVNK